MNPPEPTLRDDLIVLLRCPVSKRPLHRASPTETNLWQSAWRAGRLTNRLGRTLPPDEIEQVETFLLTDDGQFAHVVRAGIVTLLPDEAIPWTPGDTMAHERAD